MKALKIYLLLILCSTIAYGQESEIAIGYTQKGMASYYANKFHGKKTASGEKFDMYAMTAAHPKIPFNSIVKLTNLSNGKWVTVRINDRGPFTHRRILDMSKAAALKLDIIREGSAEITLEVLKIPGQESAAKEGDSSDGTPEATNPQTSTTKTDNTTPPKTEAQTNTNATATNSSNTNNTATTTQKKTDASASTSKATGTTTTSPEKTTTSTSTPTKVPTVALEPTVPLKERFKPVKTYNIWGTERQPKGFGIQLGSYTDLDKALALGKEATDLGMREVYIQTGWSNKQLVYRVLFASGTDAEKVKQLLPVVQSKGFPAAFLRSHY